jgi:hypothetical protein
VLLTYDMLREINLENGLNRGALRCVQKSISIYKNIHGSDVQDAQLGAYLVKLADIQRKLNKFDDCMATLKECENTINKISTTDS